MSTAEEGAARSHALRNSLLALTFVTAGVLVLVLALPQLGQVARRFEHENAGWLAVAVACELGSCLGYVLTFLIAFYRGPTRMAARLAWAELAANSILPAGGLGGLGLGAWVLRTRGVPATRIAERSGVVFLLTSAPSFAAGIVLGLALGLGLVAGPHDPVRALVPAALGLTVVAVVLSMPRLAPRLSRRLEGHDRIRAGLEVLANSVRASVFELRRGDWRLIGPVAYMALDVACLWACFQAIGSAPPLAAVAMGYLIGQLAGALPVPGGLGVVDGGLIGALIAYGVPAAPAAAAVLAYRVISLWLPAVIGMIAFVALRRQLEQEPVALAPLRRER